MEVHESESDALVGGEGISGAEYSEGEDSYYVHLPTSLGYDGTCRVYGGFMRALEIGAEALEAEAD